MKILSRDSIGSDIKWGLGWGLWLAVAFSLLGTALLIMQGGVLGRPSRFSFPMVIMGYFLMGAIGGLLLGIFRPLTHRRLGATILGIVVGIAVYSIAVVIAVGEKKFLTAPGLASALVLGTLMGGYLGHDTWSRYRKRG